MDHPPERFARLYDQYYRNVLRYALQHADRGSAEDVASEVCLITWRRLAALRGRSRSAAPGTAPPHAGAAINTIHDPQQLVTDLKPAMLDRLAEEGYSRRRDDDLARALATGPGPAPAAGGSRPTGRYIALAEIDTSPGLNLKNLPKNLQRALAIMKKNPILHKNYLATLKAIKDTPAVVVIQRTSVIDSLTGNTWTYQHGSGVPSELPVARRGSPTEAQFAAWPASPTALRTLLLTQGKQQVKDGVEVRAVQGARGHSRGGGQGGHGRPHRPPAIEIIRYNSVAKENSATFEDPSTGTVLESLSNQGGSSVYQSITGYASLPANPYGG